MPEYLFTNDKTKETHAVIFHMNDKKDYRGPKGDAAPGVWRRVWLKPQMAVDAVAIDPYSSSDFVKVTNKKGTIGDLHDRSTELSKKRADKDGRDPIQEKFFEDYSKKRHGKKHPVQARRDGIEALASKGIRVSGLDED